MPKDFTAEELALLEMKPSDLDPIKQEERKRLKARQYMATHRAKVRSNMGDKEYKAMRVDEMTTYRNKKQTEYLEAVKKTTNNPKEKQTIIKTIKKIQEKPTRESTRVKVPTDKRVINAPKITKESTIDDKVVVPDWKKALRVSNPNYKINSKEYMERAGFKAEALKDNYKIFSNIMSNVFNFEIPSNLKDVITFILRGNNIEHPSSKNKKLDKNNINIFKQYLDKYFNKNKIHTTLNAIIEYYYTNARDDDAGRSTVKSYTRTITNILSRIDSYHDSYQVSTKYGIELNDAYIDDMKNNRVKARDKAKLIVMRDNYDLNAYENNRKLLEENNLNSEEQALASMYLLQPPRRNETGSLRLTNKGLTKQEQALMNQEGNYIVLDDGEPVLQIYGSYKTAKKTIGKVSKEVMGQQALPISPEVGKYLKQHIADKNLKLGDYIFGSNDYSTPNTNMNKKISSVMFKIFKVKNIGSKIIRQGASMFNQQNDRSQNEKEAMAEAMGHSETVQKAIYNKVKLDEVEDEEDQRSKQVKKGNKIPQEKKQEATEAKTKPKVQLKPVEKIGNVRRNPPRKKKK